MRELSAWGERDWQTDGVVVTSGLPPSPSYPLGPLPHPQVFDNTPAALDGTVAAGDEITGVNGRSIKGKTKVEVAKMIQEVKVRLRRQWGHWPF